MLISGGGEDSFADEAEGGGLVGDGGDIDVELGAAFVDDLFVQAGGGDDEGESGALDEGEGEHGHGFPEPGIPADDGAVLGHLGAPTEISSTPMESARLRERNGECTINLHHDGNFSVSENTNPKGVARLKAIRNAPVLDWGFAAPTDKDFDAADELLAEYGRKFGLEIKITRRRGASRAIICDGAEYYSYNKVPAKLL